MNALALQQPAKLVWPAVTEAMSPWPEELQQSFSPAYEPWLPSSGLLASIIRLGCRDD
ncbi:hypothetical protein AB0N07_46945 [Streptomyces sp. NPDC051172]|uniref:hypothetical protein n=1 Tax=Streptomyces sp. NPDC051172 TaxID=3155796 RepID=UPI00342BFD12